MAARYTEDYDELARTVYVGNVSREAPWKETLQSLFEQFGAVTNTQYIQTRTNSRFAFVTFSSAASARRAFQVAKSKDGIYYHGRRLYVSPKRLKRIKEGVSEQELQHCQGPSLIDMLDQFCMLQIFDYLTLEERITCEKVCQRWEELSLQTWSTLTQLSFDSFRQDLSPTTKIEYLQRTTSALKSLHIGTLGDNIKLLDFLDFVPPSVTEFTFPRNLILCQEVLAKSALKLPMLKTVTIKDDYMSVRPENDWLPKLMESFPQVKQVTLNSNPRNCQKMLQNAATLEKVALIYYSFDVTEKEIQLENGNLQELSLTFSSNVTVIRLKCPELKVLSIINEDSYETPELNFSGLFKLVELSITGWTMQSEATRESLLQNCSALKTFKLISIDDIDVSLEDLQKLPSLRHLAIDNLLQPDVIDAVVKLKKLEKLSMRGTKPVSQQDMIRLIDGLPELKYLDVSGVEILEDNGEKISEIESLLAACQSEGRPTLELVIAKCGLDRGEKIRWKYGRFVIYNPKWQKVKTYRKPSYSTGFIFGDPTYEDLYDSDSDNYGYDYEYRYGYGYGELDDYDDYSDNYEYGYLDGYDDLDWGF
ncbi:uncharacterized protein [Watersipora subatra]|uniref:uncharacterized protein n=1 Tax=Watersipora subatra TaxID=2589382 RepID=UPI00355B06DF